MAASQVKVAVLLPTNTVMKETYAYHKNFRLLLYLGRESTRPWRRDPAAVWQFPRGRVQLQVPRAFRRSATHQTSNRPTSRTHLHWSLNLRCLLPATQHRQSFHPLIGLLHAAVWLLLALLLLAWF